MNDKNFVVKIKEIIVINSENLLHHVLLMNYSIVLVVLDDFEVIVNGTVLVMLIFEVVLDSNYVFLTEVSHSKKGYNQILVVKVFLVGQMLNLAVIVMDSVYRVLV